MLLASMADTLYTRALVRAAEIHGSTQALASVLRVPENTLLRWMAGRAQMPLQAFFKVVEIISADERKHAPVAPAAGTGKLRLRIGTLEARCPRCDGVEFVAADPGQPLRYIAELVCFSCGERAVHGNLIVQLATHAVHRSKAMTPARPEDEA
jgi:hypothetical protein